MPNAFKQQWVRIPNIHKGVGVGAMYGGFRGLVGDEE